MKLKNIARAILLIAILLAGAKLAYALDLPHNATSDPDINCGQCHYVGMDTPEEDWFQGGYESMDDTPKNRICLGCHNDTSVYNGKVTDKYKTHSSYQFSSVYEFSRQCIDCHNPHYQRHLRIYRSSAFINTGTMIGITADADPTVTLGTALSKDYENYMFIPNSKYYTLTYKIINSTDGKNSFKIRGPVKLAYAPAGSNYAIVYGRYAHETINGKAVKLFRREGANSLADGDGNYDGVCEVCHTQTQHFRGDGSAPDQLHENLSADASSGIYCIQCHSHTGGFAHGNGSGGGNCGDCHGKHADHGGVGTTQSHATHLESDSHGVRGPKLGDTACDECHDTANFPRFKDGQDLAGTTACDPCHSDGGSYNGVDSTGNSIGAKDNWRSGIYIANSVPAEKERWCAGCHDTGTSVINSVSAPPVIGNEVASYNYGTGYGYYKTGHGLDSGTKYPSSLISSGAGLACDACHDYSLPHVDGDPRTYAWNTTSADYQAGYRLKSVGGEVPMDIPLKGLKSADNFRLCYSCHDSGPFMDELNMNTNFVTDGVNRHELHLRAGSSSFFSYPVYASSWDYPFTGLLDSKTSCVTCHNVHGSYRLAMIRDGSLVDRVPLDIWYYAPGVTYPSTGDPTPASVPLLYSTGTIWNKAVSGAYCGDCHGGGNVVDLRTLFQDTAAPPVLEWAGTSGYTSDGASPESGTGGDSYYFRVKYTDINSDVPSSIQVWIDENNNGAMDSNEKYDMAELNSSDGIFYDGKIYMKSLVLNKSAPGAISNTLDYYFYAVGGGDTASGEASGDSTPYKTVTVNNGPPSLSWTGAENYINDGVDPDSRATGTNFTFSVKYTDTDNDPPSSYVKFYLDKNADLDYDDAGEIMNMTAMDSNDPNVGRVYNTTVNLTTVGNLGYYFASTDGIVAATGAPTTEATVTVTDGLTPPTLTWTGEVGYVSDGVDPDSYGGGLFRTFRVRYSDADNDAPGVVRVWVDIDNSTTYEVSEEFDMTEADSGDTLYTDGKIYYLRQIIDYPGTRAENNNDLMYRFYAEDSTSRVATGEATGAPTQKYANVVYPTPASAGAATLQAAVVEAQTNEYVVASPGEYLIDSVVDVAIDKDIYIASVYGAETTIINGISGAFGTFNIQDNADVTIEGFGIINGIRGVGGAVVVGSSGTLVLKDNVISDCRSTTNSGGGSIYAVTAGSVTLYNTTITNSFATRPEPELYGGSGGAINIGSSILNIFNSTLHNNYSDWGGGAISASTGTINIFGSAISNNDGYNGGAIVCTTCTMNIDESQILHNYARHHYGGGIASSGASVITITNSTLGSNEAAYYGGNLSALNGSIVDIVNSSVNSGIANTGYGWAGGVYVSGTLNASRSVFAGNTARDGGGASVAGTANLDNCIFSGNGITRNGAGIYANAIIANFTTFAGNNAQRGAGIYCTAACTVDNSTFWDNNVVWDKEMTDAFGPVIINYTDMEQTSGAGGTNIATDPKFVNPVSYTEAPTADGDYHIQSDSGVMDAADSSATMDIDVDGQSRPYGSASDMGADEYAP